MAQDAIEREFLAEMEALEKFRISYTAQYPNIPLGHDDPDVRRLLEAMAFFTARTRVAAMRSLDDSVQRIFRQHFPSLLGPIPALGMLRATPGEQFADVTELPRGTDVLLRKPPGQIGDPERFFRFRTLSKLRILPIAMRRVDIHRIPGHAPRIFLRLKASTAHNQALSELHLHINHQNDLHSSMLVMHALRSHTRSASVIYEESPSPDAVGQPCQVSFGAPEDEGELPDSFEHPLQRARIVLRYPRRDLYLNVKGLRPPRNWQHVTLCLDMRDSWPTQLKLTSDGFEPHTVPMINVRRDLAEPIECDGTRDRYPVTHGDQAGGFAPLWVIGAYRHTKQGFVPLEPGVVGGSGDSYEVTSDGRGDRRSAWALFNIPSAYAKPEMISVDAFWHQPGLRDVTADDLTVGLADHYVQGVKWSCSGGILPHADSEIDGDRESQLQLVSLKTLRFLGREELRVLLRVCGAEKDPEVRRIVTALQDVQVTSKPSAKLAHGLKHTYELTFGVLEPSDVPRVALLVEWLRDVLATWCQEEVLAVTARIPNLDRVLSDV